jgi:hypothetical protein
LRAEPLLGLDHLAAGKAIFTASILAQRDQVGRAADRGHDVVELVLPLAMPVHKHGEVTRRERRLGG